MMSAQYMWRHVANNVNLKRPMRKRIMGLVEYSGATWPMVWKFSILLRCYISETSKDFRAINQFIDRVNKLEIFKLHIM